MIFSKKKSLVTFAALLITTSAAAAPVTVDLIGTWYSAVLQDNLHVRAVIDSSAQDQEPLRLNVGTYSLESLQVDFSQGALWPAPASFVADLNRSKAHIYSSATQGSPGELFLEGTFATGANLFPNGIQALNFEFRMYFDGLKGDQVSDLLMPGLQPNGLASAYISDQLGARSEYISSPTVVIDGQFNMVPEPPSLALLVGGALILSRTLKGGRKSRENK